MAAVEYVLRSNPCFSAIPVRAGFNHDGFALQLRMTSTVCRCCGEPMPERGNTLSRNPNICASCSSMADGMEESNVPQNTSVAPETPEPVSLDQLRHDVEEPAVHHVPG
jgi:hypothetical protein